MGSVSTAWTSTGSAGWNTDLATVPMPAFTGSYTITWTTTTPPGSGHTWFPILQFRNAGGTACREFTPTIGGTTATWTWTETVNGVPAQWHCLDWNLLVLRNGFSDPIPSGVVWGLTVDAAALPAPGPCAYGTQRNSTAATYSLIVEDLIVAVAAALGGGPLLVTGLSVLIGSPLVFPTCDHPPPTMPVFVDSDWILGTVIPTPTGLSKLGQWFAGALWWFYCECTPAPSGSPPPTPYPNPPPPPALAPTGPQSVLVCSNTDICSALNGITNQLAALIAMVTQMYGRTTLPVTILPNQTWHPITNYAKGTVHTGLSGTGAFAISNVDGYEIQVTTRAGSGIQLPGAPPYQWNVGWVSVNNTDGMVHEKRITQMSFLWFPDQALVGTTFEYWLDPGNVITITELHATG